jgi:PAS domain S-box-containing protein
MSKQARDHDHTFRLLVEGVIDYAIFLLSPDGYVQTWNMGAQRMTGYTPGEILDRHYSCFFSPADRAAKRPENELHQAMEHGRYEEEGWRIRKNGTRYWANVVVTPIQDNGEHRGFAKVVRDLSERQHLREALQESEEKFKLLVEGTQDYAIFMLDPEGYIQSWNRGVQRIKGYTAADVIGKHFSLFYPEEDKAKPSWELEIAKKVGHYQEEGWRIKKDGSRFWASVLITALRDDTGELRGFSKVTRDLTERKIADEALLHRTGQLEKANRSLEEFAYSVSHDLRAPLRALQGFAEALSEDCAEQLDDLGRDYVRSIHAGAAAMDKLIQDLLTYSRLGMSELVVGPVEPRVVLDGLLETLRPQIAASEAQLELQGTFPTLKANRLVLTQALQNLVSNALKFTAPGQKPEITIQADGAGKISVCDHGIGVPAEYQQRIFKVFERLHGGESYPGTGIGLAIVARAVERMHGLCGVDSREGEGSCFWIQLPLWSES